MTRSSSARAGWPLAGPAAALLRAYRKRGIAVRLEDDLVVTDGAARVLSDGLPTDADELTAWMADAQR